ncbi:MAG: hypothetical protein F4Y88_02510 [Chloroflexi bacterium]|nr:hypothetical protein [Chloroflexota bacterium]
MSTAQLDFQSWFVGFPFCLIEFNRAASIARVIRGRRFPDDLQPPDYIVDHVAELTDMSVIPA